MAITNVPRRELLKVCACMLGIGVGLPLTQASAQDKQTPGGLARIRGGRQPYAQSVVAQSSAIEKY